MIRRVAVLVVVALCAMTATALADAPDPIPSATSLVGPIHVNADGSYTVTVEGQWQWTTHHSDCNKDRSGVGYAVAWNDPNDPGNFVGKNGLSALVGTTNVNGLGPDSPAFGNSNKQDGNLAHAAMPLQVPNGNDPGLGPHNITYSVTKGNPDQTDANNWISGCGTFNGTFNSGTWGPISHTYPASFAGPIVICPIMYDPHKGPAGTPNGDPGQITAGGSKRDTDNSIETNNFTPLGNGCFTRTIPRVTTTTAAAVTVGTPITDTAHLAGGNSPTGTITFQLFGPNDANCTSAPIFTSNAVAVNHGNGDYVSAPTFTPTALGTYRWIATYSGDSNNVKVPTACNDAGEQVVVGPATPGLTTTASGNGPIGTTISDTAHLSNATSTAGGAIKFELFGPNDANCSKGAIFTSTNSAIHGSGDYSSPTSFTSTAAGTYRWIATYSGDTNNNSVATSCNDANETVTINPLGPSLTTNAAGAGTIGTAVSDTAHLSGATSMAGGSITFTLYGPNDTNCSQGAIFTTTNNAILGNGNYATPSTFTSTAAGTYRWIASYSGDANNNPVSTSCNDANEAVIVGPLTPGLTTNAAGNGPIGTAISDIAHLTNATSHAGGSIKFELYGPNDANCSKGAIFTTTNTAVSGNGNYTTPNTFASTAAGTYRWIATYSGDANNNSVATSCSDAAEQVIETPLTPGVTTTAAGNGPIGTAISDTAHLTGGANPTGSITFTLYGPNDTNCSQGAIFTTTNGNVNGDGNYSTPSTFTPTDAGSYRWVATYNGDANNNSVATSCNDAGETVTITQLAPGLTTTATAGGGIGTAIGDTAHLSGATSTAGGSITFKLYGPSDPTCSQAAIFTTTNSNVAGNGNYPTPSTFTSNGAGDYHWIANYSGDTNNKPATTACGDAGETVSIGQLAPGLTTTAGDGGPIGTTVSDTAHLTGGSNPTGSIKFSLYGPSDPTCAQAAIFTTTNTNVNGDGNYPTPSTFTSTDAGDYHWIAAYSGDANNKPATTACGDAGETVTITPTTPGISTNASDGGPVGTAVHDVAHLAGGTRPGGSITFKLYGPNDAACSSSPVFTSSAVSVNGNADYTSPAFTPSQAGTYRWIATYSGDANNRSVATSCADEAESVVVTALAPTITTTASSGGVLGVNVHDVAHLSGATSAASGSIVFTLYGPNDSTCSQAAVFTSSAVPVSGNGDYTSPGYTPTQAGTYQWVAAYSGDANNHAESTACGDPNESAVVTTPPPLVPGIAVIKYARIDGTTGPFTRDVLTANPGQKIDYEMVVSNTGDLALAVNLSDPHCDAGSVTGPTGDLNGDGTLKPHGQATWFCFHIAQAGDAPSFTNTVTVTGTPPSGPPVGPVSSSVVTNVPQQQVAPSCVAGNVALTGAVGCTRRAFQAVVQAAPNSIKSVTFVLDGKTIRTLTHAGAGNKWAIRINPGKLSFGGHTLVAHVTLICNGVKRTAVLHFRHCKPPKPRFTG